MYQKAYGIIETLAPLHVGAGAGEETGNLNLIFRDQFTQTGIIPGSSIRGRFRADMRMKRIAFVNANPDQSVDRKIDDHYWYGHEAIQGQEDGGTTEAIIKFEYASLVWLPVFCPGQPVVWISCPRLLKRYQLLTNVQSAIPKPYTASSQLQGRQIPGGKKILFFNLGFMEIEYSEDMTAWIPKGTSLEESNLVVVGDNDIAQLHEMALYRQSRVKLLDGVKKVDTEKGAFFNVEALPEGSILIFPIALKEKGWQPFNEVSEKDLYFGGLESIGFGHTRVTLAGDY
jgi:CRISPR-associated protein Cmr4